MGGTVDLFHSRRTSFVECKYWVRDERNSVGDASQWILKHQATGTFLCKEISPQTNRMDVSGGVFAYNTDTIYLESDDDLHDISRGCIVLYNGKTWIVNDVQKTIHRKESEFNVEIDYKYVISIRR